MTTALVGRPTKVSRCRVPGHSSHVAGCVTCKAFSRYQFRLRQWEKSAGIETSPVPVGPIADHVAELIRNGNWRLVDIVAVSGIRDHTVRKILTRQVQRVLRVNAESLLALKPRTDPRPPMSTLVPATEAVRIARGLAAQGWTFKHMSELGGYNNRGTLAAVASNNPEWVAEETLARLQYVAKRLGRFDLAELDRPMPGMRSHLSNMARRRGWARLSAWEGRNIADPSAVPAGPVDDDLPEVSPWSYIDPILTLRIAEAVDTVRKTDRSPGHPADGYIAPLTHLTRIEAYAVAELGTASGLSAVQVAELLGYPVTGRSERANGMRVVERMKNTIRKSRAVIGQLTAGEKVDPAWCFQDPNGNGSNDFIACATALLAVQEAPFGPGWSPAELAWRAGVGECAMRYFLAYATRRGDRPWAPVKQVRRPSVHAAKPAVDVAPVDLDAVLAT